MTAEPATKRPGTGQPSRGGQAVCILVGVALLAYVAQHFTHGLHPTNSAQKQALHAVRTWAPIVMRWSLIVAGIVAAGYLIARLRGGGSAGSRGRNAAIARALGHHLRIHPDTLTVKAKKQRGVVMSGRVKYPANVPLVVDPEEAVKRALEPLAVGQLEAHHTPSNRTITWQPEPPQIETHWFDDIPLLVSWYDNLAGLLPGLKIDEENTHIPDPFNVDTAEDFTVTFRYGQTTKDLGPRFKDRVEQILTGKATVASPTGAWTLIWQPDIKALKVVTGSALPNEAPIPAEIDEPIPYGTLPLGIRSGGGLAFWQPFKLPHLLIAGATGGGKSSLMRTLIIMALVCGWEVYVADPKRVGYRHMFGTGWGLGHDRIATSPETMEQMICAVSAEVDRRYKLWEWDKSVAKTFWPILLIVDENTEAISVMTKAAQKRWNEKTPEQRKGSKAPKESPAVDAESMIARLGRQVGIFIVAGHQRPDAQHMPSGEMRMNLLGRWGLGELDLDGQQMMFGRTVKQNLHRPVDVNGRIQWKLVPGRATVNIGNGIETIQGFWTPDAADPNNPLTKEEEARLGALSRKAQQAQQQAGHVLLNGVQPIDPAAEEAAARKEWEADQERREVAIQGVVLNTVNNDADEADDDEPTTEPIPAQPADEDDTDEQRPLVSSEQPADLEPHEEDDEEEATVDSPLVDAARFVIVEQVGSTAALQRHLRVGHSKASTYMRQLEELGIVGPSVGTKPREVHATPERLDVALATVRSGMNWESRPPNG